MQYVSMTEINEHRWELTNMFIQLISSVPGVLQLPRRAYGVMQLWSASGLNSALRTFSEFVITVQTNLLDFNYRQQQQANK